MSGYPIHSDINAFTGRHTIHVGQDPATADPVVYVATVERFIALHGVRHALLFSQTPVTAAALIARPGFTIIRSDWEYTRTWPTGRARSAMPGLRVPVPEDSELIARIINDAMDAGPDGVETMEHVRNTIFAPNWFNALVCVNSEEVAYGNAIHDGRAGTIGFLCVLPVAQGRGLGRRLFDYLLAELDTQSHDVLTLVVEESNTPAIRLYESCNFIRGDGPFVQVEFRSPDSSPPSQ